MKLAHALLAVATAFIVFQADLASAKPACDPGAVADAEAAVAASCPCDAQADGTPWQNHGKYVSCVAQARNAAAGEVGIKKSCLKGVVPCAANSTCGKPNQVACTVVTGICVFPGACSSDASLPCTTAFECPAGDACSGAGACGVDGAPCFEDADCSVGDTCVFSGTCDNEPTQTCGVNADCAEEACFVASASDCEAANGVGGAGSCCAP